eukprot:35388_1
MSLRLWLVKYITLTVLILNTVSLKVAFNNITNPIQISNFSEDFELGFTSWLISSYVDPFENKSYYWIASDSAYQNIFDNNLKQYHSPTNEVSRHLPFSQAIGGGCWEYGYPKQIPYATFGGAAKCVDIVTSYIEPFNNIAIGFRADSSGYDWVYEILFNQYYPFTIHNSTTINYPFSIPIISGVDSICFDDGNCLIVYGIGTEYNSTVIVQYSYFNATNNVQFVINGNDIAIPNQNKNISQYQCSFNDVTHCTHCDSNTNQFLLTIICTESYELFGWTGPVTGVIQTIDEKGVIINNTNLLQLNPDNNTDIVTGSGYNNNILSLAVNPGKCCYIFSYSILFDDNHDYAFELYFRVFDNDGNLYFSNPDQFVQDGVGWWWTLISLSMFNDGKIGHYQYFMVLNLVQDPSRSIIRGYTYALKYENNTSDATGYSLKQLGYFDFNATFPSAPYNWKGSLAAYILDNSNELIIAWELSNDQQGDGAQPATLVAQIWNVSISD